MPVKEKLSGISLYALIPVKNIERRIIIKDEPLSSTPFIIPGNRIVTSEFTGRVKELDYLRSLYSETIIRIKKQTGAVEIQSKPIIAAIKGEAGIGKTRLVKEFISRVKKNMEKELNNVYRGSSLSTGQNSYGMFSEILRTGSQKIKNKRDTESNIAVNNFIKDTLFNEALACNKKNIPYIILLEDMQWADESSLAALEHILRSINLYSGILQPQIFFILNYRTGFKHTKALRSECDYRELELEGFSECETEKLIAGLTCGNTINGKTKEIITSRSDGNPFNIEEWCMLIAENKKLSQIPQTVKHLLVERVESLSPEERSVLIIASVLGRKFELKIIKDIQNRAGKDVATAQVMQSLIEKRFLVNLTGDVYEFRHDILQETIYRELRKDVKLNVHLLAGNAIEALYPGSLSNYYYELARHYVAAKNETKSIEYLEKSGDKAKDNFEYIKSSGYYQKLLCLLNEESTSRLYNTNVKISEVFMILGDFQKAELSIFNALKLSQGNIAQKVKILILYIELLFRNNLYAKAKKYINKTIKLLETNDEELLIIPMFYLAMIYREKGNIEKSLSILYKVLKYSKSNNNLDGIIKSSGYIGIIHREKGEYSKASAFLNEALNKAKQNGQRYLYGNFINSLGAVNYYTGNYDSAINNFSESSKINSNIGHKKGVISAIINLVSVYLVTENYSNAEKKINILIKLCLSLGDFMGLSSAYNSLGTLYMQRGNYIQSKEFFEKAADINNNNKRKIGLSSSYGNLGIVNKHLGNFHAAFHYFNKQYKLDVAQGNLEGKFKTLVNISLVHYSKNNLSLAVKTINKAISIGQSIHLGRPLKLAYLNIAEYLCDSAKYSDALKNIKFFFQGITNSNNISHDCVNALLIKAKIEILMKIAEVSNKKNITKEDKSFLYSSIKDIKALIRKSESMILTAYGYFTFWLIVTQLQKLGLEHYNAESIRSKALKIYKKLYKEYNKFEYKVIISKLTT